MTRAEDLLKALNGLKNAADNELSGEANDVAMRHIKGLFRLADFDGEDTGEGANEASIPLARAIAEVRTQAEGEMSGNAFYLASKSLDDIANLSSSPANAPLDHAPEPVTEPAPQFSEPPSQTPAESLRAQAPSAGPSFDELGAASKTRVKEFATRHAATLHEYHEPLELEKRSSEPCSMPEIVPLAEESSPHPVPSPIEAASAREVAEATHDFGIPAAVAGPVPEYAAPYKEPAPAPSVIVTKTAPRPAAPAREAPPVTTVKNTGAASKQQQKEPEKTFFSLWFDMVFARKK